MIDIIAKPRKGRPAIKERIVLTKVNKTIAKPPKIRYQAICLLFIFHSLINGSMDKYTILCIFIIRNYKIMLNVPEKK